MLTLGWLLSHPCSKLLKIWRSHWHVAAADIPLVLWNLHAVMELSVGASVSLS